MKLSEYQKLAARTSGENFRTEYPYQRLTVACMGLTGEAGEFVDWMKKVVAHGHPLDRERAAKELGDVLWYVAEAATSLDLDLDMIAALNIDKLARRYPNGFSSEASINRKDGDR